MTLSVASYWPVSKRWVWGTDSGSGLCPKDIDIRKDSGAPKICQQTYVTIEFQAPSPSSQQTYLTLLMSLTSACRLPGLLAMSMRSFGMVGNAWLRMAAAI